MPQILTNIKQGLPHLQPIEVLTVAGTSKLTDGGILFIGGAAARAIALPAPTNNGARLTIVAITAQAHTVTVTAGFNGAGAGADVATFGGAIGDSIEVVSYAGNWYVLQLRNVTLG